jgi:proline-specific peptidase
MEDLIEFHGSSIWYHSIGIETERGKLPLLCLHGGPGAAHFYLEPLEGLADTGRYVAFYDQLGCGNSSRPRDPGIGDIQGYLDELAAVVDGLGLERFHLLGHSWGGMLALEYALLQPPGLTSLILASTPINMRQMVAEANGLRAQLPADLQEALERGEREGTTDDPAFDAAMDAYYKLHVCRLEPWPESLARTWQELSDNAELWLSQYGPSEFRSGGALADWDISDRLGGVRLPALVTSGKYDEVTPVIAGELHQRLLDSRWELFEESAHMAHLEETARYLPVLERFLAGVEAAAG